MNIKDPAALGQKIKGLEQSGTDDDYNLLLGFYTVKRNKSKVDSISQVAVSKYPAGKVAFQQAYTTLSAEKDPARSDKELKDLQKKFGSLPEYNKQLSIAPLYVAQAYAGKANQAKLEQYIKAVPDSMLMVAYFSIGNTAAQRGDLSTGAALLRLAVDRSKAKEMQSSGVNGQNSAEYYAVLSAYADVLLKNKKFGEGLPFAREIYTDVARKSLVNTNRYADYLIGAGDLKTAYPLMETTLEAGAASPATKENFKKAYAAQKGTLDGFDQLTVSIDSAVHSKMMSKLSKMMINTPAYGFVLKDLKGNTVSLASLKGKVVLLDFWATWCGPCKASFPAMQLAQNQYKNDPDVKFLFIHTMEQNDPDPAKSAADYIKSQQLDFDVLVDPRDPLSGKSDAAAGFGINALPTKLIIDKQGHIRFKYSGGGVPIAMDAFLSEASAMIELAKKN